MDHYEPFTRGLSTRLERELERLSLPGQVELSTLVKKDEEREQVSREGYLFHLDRSTRVDDVIERIRHAGASGAFTSDDHSHSSDDDTDDEEHARSRHVALRSKMKREKASKTGRRSGGESNPESGYDSDKSEEEVSEKDAIFAKNQGISRKLSSIKLRALSRDDLDDDQVESSPPVKRNISRGKQASRGESNSNGMSRFLPGLSSSSNSVEMKTMSKPSKDYVVDIDPEDINIDDINIDDDDFDIHQLKMPYMTPSAQVDPRFQKPTGKAPYDEYDIDDSDREDEEDMEPVGKNHHQSQKVFDSDDYDYNIEDDDYDDPKKTQLRERMAELEKQHQFRMSRLQMRSDSSSGWTLPKPGSGAQTPKRTIFSLPKIDTEKAGSQLRSAISEFYRGLILLQNFATLNVEATQKILKKHDKNIELGAREKFTQSRLQQFSFYRRRSLKALMRETEHVFAVCFTEGHRTDAMKVLRVPTEKKSVGVATFRFGFFLGISIALFTVCLYLTTVLDTRLLDKMRPGLIVYRMLWILVMMLWYWGVDMWVWTKHRVNYVFIFEFNPRRHVRYQHIFEAAAIFTFFLVTSLLIYMLTAAQDGVFGWEIPGFTWMENIPPHVIPLSLLIVVVFLALWIQIKSNFWLLRTLSRIMGAPFIPVVFRDFFIADQILSMIIALQDLEYVICYYATDAWTGANACFAHQAWVFPVIAVFPSMWRLLQCIRRFKDTKDSHQLINAAKYSSGLVVITASAIRKSYPNAYTNVFWFLAIVVSTIFTFLWDLIKDWSLGHIRNVKHKFLRSELLYPTSWYYTALLMNLGMRLMWTLTISPEAVRGVLHPDVFAFVLAMVEVTRRAVWNMFRLENEQLNNCGKFRALKDIPLPLPVEEPDSED